MMELNKQAYEGSYNNDFSEKDNYAEGDSLESYHYDADEDEDVEASEEDVNTIYDSRKEQDEAEEKHKDDYTEEIIESYPEVTSGSETPDTNDSGFFDDGDQDDISDRILGPDNIDYVEDDGLSLSGQEYVMLKVKLCDKYFSTAEDGSCSPKCPLYIDNDSTMCAHANIRTENDYKIVERKMINWKRNLPTNGQILSEILSGSVLHFKMEYLSDKGLNWFRDINLEVIDE